MKNCVPLIRKIFFKLKISFQKNIMNKMDNKTFTACNIEKHMNNYYKKYSECKDCNIKLGAKRYFDDKDKISNQQKK